MSALAGRAQIPDLQTRRGGEWKALSVGGGRECASRSPRTLKRKKPPAVEDLVLDATLCAGHVACVPLSELLGEPGEVAVAADGVGDYVVGVGGVLCDDGVVDDAALGVEEDGEGGCVRGEGREGGWG